MIAGGDITVDVRRVRSWSIGDDSGVEFYAGGEIDDVRDPINDEYEHEGEPVEFPVPIG